MSWLTATALWPPCYGMQQRQFARAAPTRPSSDEDPRRLIRLIDELRALDLERRRQPVTSLAFHELARRAEAKAREVFAEAAGGHAPALESAGDPERRSASRPPH
jgi:hypothetical protein